MDDTARTTCRFCAEPIHPEALRCPSCRSFLRAGPPLQTFRDRPGRQLAGVSIALAHGLGVSVTLVRLAFIVLTFTSFVGPLIYVALWLLIPLHDGASPPLDQLLGVDETGPSIADRLLHWARNVLQRVADWFRPTESPTPPSGPASPAGGAS